mmetsp:Transcript_14108/g.30660  ORF Transcript_14108/g.30660 Transcript_14108/m.30660 type:complete len:736 (+) Transcript_14108:72-2279(+)
MPPEAHSSSDSSDLAMNAVDLEHGVAATATAAVGKKFPQEEERTKNGGKQLRWTRITKSVEIKDVNAGLLRGSIASPSPDEKTIDTIDLEEATDPDPSQEASSKGNKAAAMKTILNGVSGSASPGQVLALMGPSGSGKTSILDVLSGRSAYDKGVITLDGEIVTDRVMKKMKKKVAYVKQSDLFFGYLTVRDQLTYTAFLRLPSDWAKSRKVEEVNRIIKQLRLGKCADTPIFMISGGEKKRVNIGSELLTDPAIILLDEPTSGLDSTSAVALMRILHNLARDEGKTIITSIHQPSSAVFFGFDKLMLLADGNVVYFGTPQGSLEHVKELGLECPAGYNAADHHMDLLVVDSAIDEQNEDENKDDFKENSTTNDDNAVTDSGLRRRKKLARRQTAGGTTTKQKLIDSWDAEGTANQIQADDAEEQAQFGIGPGGNRRQLSKRKSIVMTEKSFNSTWWTQYTVLVHRSMKNSRSAILTPLNLTKAGLIGFMCGLLWFQMPYTESTVFDRSSYYFFTMTFWVFDAMFTAYMAFPLERAIIFKERSSGSYHLSAYFLAKTTSEAPARLALPAIYMLISYWMSGVNNDFGVFISSTVCSLLSVLAGESIGLFLGAAVLDIEKGMVIMTVTALVLMVVGGFFVRNIPSWILWLGYISPFKYSYNSSVQLVFNKPVPCDGSGVLAVCNGGSTGYASEQEVLDFLGVQFSAGVNAALLLAMFIVIRIMAFFALKNKKADERM